MRTISLSLLAALSAATAGCIPQDHFVKDTTNNIVPKGGTAYIELFNTKWDETHAREVESIPREPVDPVNWEESDGWSESQRGLQYRFYH